jgi:hypothetical protein
VEKAKSVKVPTESFEKAKKYAESLSPSSSITSVMVAAIDMLVDSSKMLFKSGDRIKHEGKKYSCVSADKSTATFAPMVGTKTIFKNMFAVANDPSIKDFQYQKL